MSLWRRRIGAVGVAVASLAGGFGLLSAENATAVPNTSAVALTAAGALVPLGITPGATPSVTPAAPVSVTGLAAGQTLVGIDYRPATGGLYGLGVNSSTGAANVYLINPATGAAAAQGASVTLTSGPLSWGVDFNPTVDRIRVVNSQGKNFRLHPDTGAIVATDGALAFVATDANVGDTPAIASSAYTNNFGGGSTLATGAKATTLYGLDAFNDALVAVEAPNAGELRTVGALGADIGTDAEFDITSNGLAYALVETGGQEFLRNVNLATGALGAPSAPIAGGPFVGLAIETGATPVVAGDDGYAVTDVGDLVTFELADPSTTATIGRITGLGAGFEIEGIDSRPTNGELVGLAINPTTRQAKVVKIDRQTAVATPVGSAFSVNVATDYGFDFNPTVDRIRFVTSGGSNLRLHPDTGAVAATDGTLTYIPGDAVTAAPVLTSTAYSNSFGGAAGTIHFGIDAAQDTLAVFTDSNGGKLRTQAKLSLASAPFDVIGDTGLDVASDGRVFLAAESAGATKLFTANPITGALTAVGANNTIGSGSALRAFAIGRNFVRPTITITADSKSRAYLDPNPTFTFTATGFLPGDSASSLDSLPTCSTTATQTSPVGTYVITCTGGSDDRYTFAFVDGSLTIVQTGTVMTTRPLLPDLNLRNVTATLRTASGQPVAGATVRFTTAGSTVICDAVTNADGNAQCPLTTFRALQVVLNGYDASFAGNANLAPSSSKARLLRLPALPLP